MSPKHTDSTLLLLWEPGHFQSRKLALAKRLVLPRTVPTSRSPGDAGSYPQTRQRQALVPAIGDGMACPDALAAPGRFDSESVLIRPSGADRPEAGTDSQPYISRSCV